MDVPRTKQQADQALVNWLAIQISHKLDFDNGSAGIDLASYVVPMDGADAAAYLEEVLGGDCGSIVNELAKRKQAIDAQFGPPPNAVAYRKDKGEGDYMSPKSNKGHGKPQKTSDEGKSLDVSHHGHMPIPSKDPSGKRKKPQFVNLLSKEGEGKLSTLLPGRVECNCSARMHELINNCLKCGRIVCKQEGPGPCLFCGALVVTPQQQEILQRKSNKASKFVDKLLVDLNLSRAEKEQYIRSALPDSSSSSEVTDTLLKSVERKNKLLSFDRSDATRSRVIDDQADYFSADTNRWLSGDEKKRLKQKEQELRDKAEMSRKKRTITIDFAGRRVVRDDENHTRDIYDQSRDYAAGKGDELDAMIDLQHQMEARKIREGLAANRENPLLDSNIPRPEYVGKTLQPSAESSNGSRIQDTQLREMSDAGMCMSMHQPWASLLTRGLKQHEGRTWYTPHRGRLWIAAGVKEMEDTTRDDMEAFYASYYNRRLDELNFPEYYPTGCLLGCVDVEDCLSQEEYRKKYPQGESQSDFVLICKNPQELLVSIPMKGQHKIYKLEKDIHEGARYGIKPANPGL